MVMRVIIDIRVRFVKFLFKGSGKGGFSADPFPESVS